MVGFTDILVRHESGFDKLRQVGIDSPRTALPWPLLCTGHELKFQVNRRGNRVPPGGTVSVFDYARPTAYGGGIGI